MFEIANDIEYCSDRSQSSTLQYSQFSHSQAPDISWQKELDQLPEWNAKDNNQTTAYNNIRQELYDSERTYLTFLVAIQKLFVNPLAHLPRLVKKTELRSLFGEITSIYNVNKELLYEMRVSPTVDQAFSQLTPFLKFYTTFARNYTNSQKVFNKLMLRTEFRDFIEEQEKDPACQGIKFCALMIMPVQRVPRYILLLKRLREETTNAEEKRELKNLLERMNEITGLIEGCISDFENGEKLWSIQESLGLKEDIVAPGRRLIREGSLFKRAHCGESTYHERSFWLFNDILVYGKKRLSMGSRYECSCIFPLRHCTLDYNEIDGSLLIRCKTHSVLVTSDSYESLRGWHEEISTAVERSKMLRSTLRKESSRQQVKEFKSHIKKKFTKKFINKTYLYDMTNSRRESRKQSNKKKWEEAASCSEDVNVMVSPPAAEVPKRKRRADTEFDVELRSALQRRRLAGLSYIANESIDNLSFEGGRQSSCGQASSTVAQVDVNTGLDGEDQCDRVPRTRSKTREQVKQRAQATLSQPEIRKYSYQMQEPSAPEISECSTNESSFADLPESSSLASKTVPWWVAESTPAMFAKRKEKKGIVDTVKSCSIM